MHNECKEVKDKMTNILKKFTKQILPLFLVMFISLSIAFILPSCTQSDKKNSKIKVVTSFFPVYVAALNITDGVDNIELLNLTPYSTGCLHDYQLTTADIKILKDSTLFIANGNKMESFIEKVITNHPNLNIKYASENIETQSSDPHIWTSISLYIDYVANITNYFKEADPSNTSKYDENFEKYKAKLLDLNSSIKEGFSNLKTHNIVIFSEAFSYFANEFGLNILINSEHEHDFAHSADEIEEIIHVIEDNNVKALFAEINYSDSMVNTIVSQTGLTLYTLDPLTANAHEDYANDIKNYYLNGMKNNADIIKSALSK